MGMISKKAGGASALGLAVGAAMMMAQPVTAAVEFDFAALANEQETFWDSKQDDASPTSGGSFASGVWTKSDGGVDIGVEATASRSATDPEANGTARAYLDKGPAPGRAGLGVCNVDDGATTNPQCSPANDDNTGNIGGTGYDGSFEELILNFDKRVKDVKIEFKGEGHTDFNRQLKVSIDGSNYFTVTSVNKFYTFAGASMDFYFRYMPVLSSAGTVNEFYIASALVSAVPLPAGVLLLGSALGGLGLMKRRRKAA